MNEEEKNNLFGTFEAVIKSAYSEKMEDPKWKKKIEKTNLKANIGLQVGENEIFYINLTITNGELKIGKGNLEDYDIELISTPEDLMFLSNGTYSTVHMITKKNQYGKTKLKVKKGGRNLGKLLFLQQFLAFK
ncbi:MAG: hypothetical protein ACTSU2_08755 [Promethearchaeota archaeon]